MANVINATSTNAGGLISTGDDSGVLNIQTNETTALSIDASQNVTFTNAANLPNTFGFKNRLINGRMEIDQRNAGASVSASNGTYYLDRWVSVSNGTGFTSTVQRSVTTPANFTNSLLLTTSTTKTPASGEGFTIVQKIEGYNTADFGFGTANAKKITLSFYVRSSKTGTYSVTFINSAFDRSYVAEYTISSANTWEQKSITLTGDTSGTWNTTTSMGVGVYFSVSNGDGTNTTATIGSWLSGNYYLGSQNQVNLFDASSANFYITGVQLELGSAATSFDYRPYGTELALCMRYFEYTGQLIVRSLVNSSYQYHPIFYKVRKRASATVTKTDSSSANVTSTNVYNPSDDMVEMLIQDNGSGANGAAYIFFYLSISAEL